MLADLPKTVTTLGLRMANEEDPARSQRGVALLRVFGSTNYLLRACYESARGLRELFGYVLRDNTSMLAMSRELGFTVSASDEGPGVMHVSLALERDGR